MRSRLVVRHEGDRLVVRSRPRSRRRPSVRLGGLAAATVLVLLASVTALLELPVGGEPQGPCPDRVSLVLSDRGVTLRIRPEDAGGNTLIHLCTAPVHGWRVSAAGRAIAVQSLGDRIALACVPRGATLGVEVRLPDGTARTFRTVLPTG